MADLSFSRKYVLALICLVLLLKRSEALVLEEEFTGVIVTDMKVNLPADEIWAVYRRHDFDTILWQLNPNVIKQVDYINGDGGVGTLINITTQSEVGGAFFVDEVLMIDDATMTKVTRSVGGLMLELGFRNVSSNVTVIAKGNKSSVAKYIFPFLLKQDSLESMSQASFVRATWFPAIPMIDYVNSLRSTPLVLRKEFEAEIVTDMKVNLPADDIWDVFGSKEFGHLLVTLSPGYFKQIEYVNGDGGVGTVWNITLQDGLTELGTSNWRDKIIKIDDGTMTISFLRRIEGGVLNSGFTKYSSGYKIMRGVNNSCVIRAFSTFEIKAGSMSNGSSVVPNWDTARTIANYVNTKKF